MKKIGSGLQYNVYELNKKQVQKNRTSLFQRIWTLHSWGGKFNFFKHPLYNIRFALSSAQNAQEALKGLAERYETIDLKLLGNPRLLPKCAYQQDKVQVFGKALDAKNFEEKKTLIAKYVHHMEACWRNGFSDTVFNFTINNGVDAAGDVILIDLGEISWKKEEINLLLKKKKWKSQWSFQNLDEELREYAEQIFEKHFTPKAFQKEWLKFEEK